MPLWREYRDEAGNYVPYKTAEEYAKERGKSTNELFTIVEVYAEHYPDNYAISFKGNFRGEGYMYSAGERSREIETVEIDGQTICRIKKN